MDAALLQTEPGPRLEARRAMRAHWFETLRDRQIEGPALTLALAAVPVSIAVSESFLAIALGARMVRCFRGGVRLVFPRAFWWWLAWAGIEGLAWLFSPELGSGWSEIRHLFLIGALFFVLPALDSVAARRAAWLGVFIGSAVGSLFLIGDFVTRFFCYQREITSDYDVSFYLRTGGLLHNWMVYGTVEILVVAGLLSFWFEYPEERRRWSPLMALNAIAAVLSLTRTVWVACFLMLAIQLWWRRSRWLWVLPVLPLAAYVLAPGPVRARLNVSMHLSYFSNAERLQMARVGWRMVRQSPLVGVGAGRVEKLYRSFLSPTDPVPGYHGHLHNNLVQLAAQFGIPAAVAAFLFTTFLFRDLVRAGRAAEHREERFLCQAALLSLTGFLVAGCFDYTYGHSLALILLAFAVLSPLLTSPDAAAPSSARHRA